MAIQIPIISDFDGKGISKAIEEFKNLEGAGKKAQFAIKKAAVPAAAALGGIAVLLGDATKAAVEDAAAQQQLAYQLKNATGATDAQIASVEDWIGAQGRLLGVADDQLRPALQKLAHQTGSIEQAQRGVTLAMDISAATGKDLSTVTSALEKAYGGNLNALAKLDPGMRDIIKSGIDLEDALGMLEGRFVGSAQEAANTAEGGFKKLSLSLSETKESIGAALLPIVEKALPILQKFADWAQKNPTLFVTMAAAIGGVALAIVAVNAAMALNPFSAIAAGVALLVVGLVTAYKKFEWFRDGVNSVVNGVLGYFETLINGWIMVINGVIRAWNLVPGHKDIQTLSHVTLGRVGMDNSTGGGGMKIPAMAQGGIVTSPTLALIGEAGPEAVVPLSKMGQMGGGVTINVNGGDPQSVVNALRSYMFQNGSVPIRVAG